MRLSYLLTAFLAGLSIASPVPNPNAEPAGTAELEVRGGRGGHGGGHGGHGGHGGTSGGKGGSGGGKGGGGKPNPPKITTTAAYDAALKAHHGLEQDKWYYFFMETPLGQSIPDDYESKDELQKLQKKLGFEHIYIVVGKVEYHETGKGTKFPKIKKDFNAYVYHMVKQEKPDNEKEYKTQTKNAVWKPDARKHLKYGGAVKHTSKAEPRKMKSEADAYIKDHPIYSVDNNNCNSFAQAMAKLIK